MLPLLWEYNTFASLQFQSLPYKRLVVLAAITAPAHSLFGSCGAASGPQIDNQCRSSSSNNRNHKLNLSSKNNGSLFGTRTNAAISASRREYAVMAVFPGAGERQNYISLRQTVRTYCTVQCCTGVVQQYSLSMLHSQGV